MQIIPDPLFSAIMTVPFLVMFLVLKLLLIDPLLQYMEGRDAAISGSVEEAKQLQAAAEAKVSELEARLADARAQAADIRAEHRERGLEAERQKIEVARKAAETEVATAVAEIIAERERARASIEEMAKEISLDIASRVLGRGVQA